jgi:hypothetical protein
MQVELAELGTRLTVRDGAASGCAVGQAVSLSARPEAVVVEDGAAPTNGASNRVSAVVEALLYMGDRSECEVRAGREAFSVLVEGDRSLRAGQPVALHFPPDKLTVWPQ